MKTNIAKLLIFLSFVFFSVGLMAQTPPHPPSHGQTTDQNPTDAGAPVGSGLVILIGLGAAYGAKKVYKANKQDEE